MDSIHLSHDGDRGHFPPQTSNNNSNAFHSSTGRESLLGLLHNDCPSASVHNIRRRLRSCVTVSWLMPDASVMIHTHTTDCVS